MLSEPGDKSPSWFISYISILNMLEANSKITWQPQAFLSFASTLCEIAPNDLAEQVCDTLLVGLAQSGISVIDEDTIARVFGGVIDQAKLNIEELHQQYEETLRHKYGESLESVWQRVAPSNLPMAAVQLAKEIVQAASERTRLAEMAAVAASKRAQQSEKELQKVEKFRRKLAKKQSSKRRKKKANSKKK